MSEHRVEVFMDFSGTEIQAEAKYRVTGEEVKTVCDFLSINEVKKLQIFKNNQMFNSYFEHCIVKI